MNTKEISTSLGRLFSELAQGANDKGGAFILNSGDIGLLRSLDKLSAADASRSVNQGAAVAAHALHLTYGLSLMNRWAREGGNPFANAKWDEAWKTSTVNDSQWQAIRKDLGRESAEWLRHLEEPRDVTMVELNGMAGSIAHLAYHLGAIRQIDKSTRGPKEGSYK